MTGQREANIDKSRNNTRLKYTRNRAAVLILLLCICSRLEQTLNSATVL